MLRGATETRAGLSPRATPKADRASTPEDSGGDEPTADGPRSGRARPSEDSGGKTERVSQRPPDADSADTPPGKRRLTTDKAGSSTTPLGTLVGSPGTLEGKPPQIFQRFTRLSRGLWWDILVLFYKYLLLVLAPTRVLGDRMREVCINHPGGEAWAKSIDCSYNTGKRPHCAPMSAAKWSKRPSRTSRRNNRVWRPSTQDGAKQPSPQTPDAVEKAHAIAVAAARAGVIR